MKTTKQFQNLKKWAADLYVQRCRPKDLILSLPVRAEPAQHCRGACGAQVWQPAHVELLLGRLEKQLVADGAKFFDGAVDI